MAQETNTPQHQSFRLTPPANRKGTSNNWKGLPRSKQALVIATPFIFLILLSIAFHSGTNTPTAATSSTPAQPAKPSSQSQKLTADRKQQVSADLNNGLTHYVDTWHQGEQILGTTQYADANAGLAAMDDPNSAAAKFSAWRQSSNIETDVTAYLNAFKSADAFYNADNEPQAIASYRDDLGTLQADISTWVTDAVGWQIQTTSNATMTKDVQTINNDISQVKSDIQATLAAT
jgi:hypothetical protein